MTTLLINPEELVLLGLVLAPEVTRYYAIGMPTRSWQSLTSFLVDAIEDLACSPPIESSDPDQVLLECADTLALRQIEAGPGEIRLHLEWCGMEREMVYFIRDPADAWPQEITGIDVVIDVGPQPPPLSDYVNCLAPRLAPAAVLLATADDHDTRFYPFFPRVEKPAPPVPGIVREMWRLPIYRFQCLRALLEPHQHDVEHEISRERREESDDGAHNRASTSN